MLLRSVTVPNDSLKTDAILRGNFDNDACSHAKRPKSPHSGILRMRQSTSRLLKNP